MFSLFEFPSHIYSNYSFTPLLLCNCFAQDIEMESSKGTQTPKERSMRREGTKTGPVRSMDYNTPQSNRFGIKFERYNNNSGESYTRRHKRMKLSHEGNIGQENAIGPNSVDYSDPFAVSNLKKELEHGIYGYATKYMEDLRAQKFLLLKRLLARYPSLSGTYLGSAIQSADLDDDCVLVDVPAPETLKSQGRSAEEMRELGGANDKSIIILDSDEENFEDKPEMQLECTPCYQSGNTMLNDYLEANRKASHGYQEALVKSPAGVNPVGDLVVGNCSKDIVAREETTTNVATKENRIKVVCEEENRSLGGEPSGKLNGEYVGVQDDSTCTGSPQNTDDDGFGDMWREMALALECAKVGDWSKYIVAREETTTEVATKENGIKVVCEEQNRSIGGEPSGKPNGEYVGVQDDSTSTGSPQSTDDDGFGDEWREMALALECAKDDTPQISAMACSSIPQEGDECEHSYILKDDLGYVCRICGVIEKRIEMIFDFQWKKGTNTSRTYASESRSVKEEAQFSFSNTAEEGFNIADISVHPRHMKQMKSHQLEGFNFLRRKLVSDKPSGCVLAHAPGSGKTFVIISFMQSFLAKYPNARPLVVLPKGILGTWKREFLRWQVEEIALYDFYSVKADNRSQQLDVLKEWVENRGILFLGYKQFANIVSDSTSSKASASCHDILLRVPTIMILDEGHTPRNENTDVVHSLSRVQTPRKVVLSGTLFQNHVKEVFNILNLVCSKFLKLETSKAIVRRVLSRVQISGGRRQAKSGVETLFYDSVEEALQNDGDFRKKVMVIQDLREMTKDVLHYYKGDFLEELPGLVDVTVLLNLGPRQKKMIEKLKKLEKFKRSSLCNAVYVHPQLKEFSESLTTSDKGWNANDSKIDRMLNTLDVKEGVKAKFFISLLGLCESSGEKMLVFSQYLLPLKFLERLVTKMKGWSFGKEIFAISGDSTQENREWSMERFNNSPDAKVLFGSIKACGEGISLVGASRLLILDVHLNPSVTRQAIGRAFRPGQLKKVYTYRLVAADSPEEEDHSTCFRKELIAKMWFEWTEYCGDHDFAMEKVEAEELGDMFWESPSLREDVQNLFKR